MLKTLMIAPHRYEATPAGCKLWLGSVTKSGYPQVNVKVGNKWRTKRLTRLICEEFHGPLGSLEARHTCNVRRCIEPTHLVPGTHQQNMDDKQAAGTHHKGERNPNAKLTPDKVQTIRNIGSANTQAVIAAQFGVSRQAISKVLRGDRWC